MAFVAAEQYEELAKGGVIGPPRRRVRLRGIPLRLPRSCSPTRP